MGGGTTRPPYPKWVWSPAGGWWHNPTHWKRNTAILGLTFFSILGLVYTYTAPKTITYTRKYVETPKSDEHGHGHKSHH